MKPGIEYAKIAILALTLSLSPVTEKTIWQTMANVSDVIGVAEAEAWSPEIDKERMIFVRDLKKSLQWLDKNDPIYWEWLTKILAVDENNINVQKLKYILFELRANDDCFETIVLELKLNDKRNKTDKYESFKKLLSEYDAMFFALFSVLGR